MKKLFLFLASAALLLAGCAKEQIVGSREGGMTKVTFTANLDNSVVTKALADGDGAAAKVNRCIMEIYYGDALYTRQYAPVSDKQATFKVQVVSNRTYKVAFWADHVEDASSEEGLATDKYYTTDIEGQGLQAITIKNTTDARYIGNDDARDAFFAYKDDCTVAQEGTTFTAKLKRPFAQMNVITTDWDKVSSIEALKPQKVNVILKSAPVKFNAVTGEASGSQDLNYEAAVYAPDAHGAEKTLSMDYLFASADKAVIDIDWKALHGSDANVKHTFAAVPYQRNYRTNIKGNLLTTQGQWKVTVESGWTSPEYTHPVVIATTLDEAQAAVGPAEAGTQAAGIVIVKQEAVTNRDQAKDKEKGYVEDKTPGITLPDGTKAIEFVLTQQSKKDVTFELPALPNENFYWYIRHEDNYPTENLNIKVDSNDATRVIVDAPDDTHVVLNDVEYTHVIAITGDNTLVVPQGITVQKLTVKKGGVEIHGIVKELEVAPGESQKVYFRECEGLSAAVFEKIYKQGICNYIDPMYTYELVGEKYNIYKLPVVAMIGEKEYPSIAAAVAAADANDVIDVVAESVELPALNKADITVKGNGTTKVTKFGGLSGKNVTLDGFEFTVETNPSGENFVIKNSKFTGKNGLRWAYAYGEVLIENCIFDTKTYGIHFDSNTGGIVTVKDCEIVGFNTFNPHLIFDNCDFVDSKNGNMYYVVQSWSDIVLKNCSFSEKWCDTAGAQTIGLTTETGLAEISNCTFATGTVYDACKNSELGVIAIDATGNATDGFTAGTFMAKRASDIKVAGLNEVVPVEGMENVYTIVPKTFPENIVAVCNGNEYETIEAALDAAYQAKGGEITLVKDVTLAKSQDFIYNVGTDRQLYDFVLNLNGKTIYRGEKNYFLDLTNNNFIVIDEVGTGTINKTTDGLSKLTLSTSQEHGAMLLNLCKLETCPVFIVNGGTYVGDGDLKNPFSCKYGIDFSAGATGDNHMTLCRFEINGGNIKNIRILNGKGEIKNGTISGQIRFDIDDTKYTQFGIENKDILTTISGGNFILDIAKTPFIFVNNFKKEENLRIIGGTFNFNPSTNYSACIPAGYISQDNGDGTWTVVAAN